MFDLSKYHAPLYSLNFKIKYILWFIVSLFFFGRIDPGSTLRVFLLRLFGSSVGRGVIIKGEVYIKEPWRLVIGNNVWIGAGFFCDNVGQLFIGDNVAISQKVTIINGNHNYKSINFDLIRSDVEIKSNVWIGCLVSIVGNVCIPEGSIIKSNQFIKGDFK